MAELDQWLDRISAIHPVGWDLGLERVGEVGERLDLLHPSDKVILVAGTNGKGSACQYLSRLTRAAGLKTGLSTSPHLYRFNERIVIGAEPVTDELIVDAFEQIELARGDITLTYFEFASLASMFIFKDQGVGVSILEVGLGGRLRGWSAFRSRSGLRSRRSVGVRVRVRLQVRARQRSARSQRRPPHHRPDR